MRKHVAISSLIRILIHERGLPYPVSQRFTITNPSFLELKKCTIIYIDDRFITLYIGRDTDPLSPRMMTLRSIRLRDDAMELFSEAF